MCSWPNLVQIVSHLGILELVSPFLATKFDICGTLEVEIKF